MQFYIGNKQFNVSRKFDINCTFIPFLQGFKRVSARGSKWPISSSITLSTAAAESLKPDMLIFSKSRSRGDLYILFIVSDGNFDQCILILISSPWSLHHISKHCH